MYGYIQWALPNIISYVIKFKYISNKIPNYVTAELSSYVKNEQFLMSFDMKNTTHKKENPNYLIFYNKDI